MSNPIGEIVVDNELLTCKNCGWSFFKVSRDFADFEIKRFKEYYDTLTLENQELLYGSEPASWDTYSKCVVCNGSHKNMRPYDLKIDNNLDGHTIGPMLDPSEDI